LPIADAETPLHHDHQDLLIIFVISIFLGASLMSANSINQKLKALPPKGKKVKRFLEKSVSYYPLSTLESFLNVPSQDALSLAASIAEDIEKKSTVRSEKQQKIQVVVIS